MATESSGAIRHGSEVEQLRATERERLRALVAADLEVCERLHAEDFQLINPRGQTFTKAEYLGGIASGGINYLAWEPDAIAIRLQGDMACLRYQARTEIIVDGHRLPPVQQWHTDIYERRDGQWQVVWSQATAIA